MDNQAKRALHTTEGLQVKRFFTHPGEDIYRQIEWVLRTSVISEPDGRIVFKQENVEVPSTWSQLATDILASKYFRRAGIKNPKTGEFGPETSAREVVDRIVTTFRKFGEQYGYFTSLQDGQAFEDELRYLLITQRAAFNSPVWFNVGHYHHHGITKDGDNWAWNMEQGGVHVEQNYYLRPQGAAC
ncbi:MAG TPA: vitamin B12-dependent ribonucleotide reductase, partial [Candidatus Thermoplasmatota archaeon]